MATGYTAEVGERDDLTFRAFALRCARAFGPCVMQRDEALDQAPKLRDDACEWEVGRVKECEARVAEAEGMTLEQASVLLASRRATLEREQAAYSLERREKRRRYERMLALVRAWTPLEESIEWDCRETSFGTVALSAEEFLAAERESAREDLVRARERLAEERLRIADANAWIASLYRSFGGVR